MSAGTGPGACHGETCVTCSDSAIPATVLRLLDDALAEVDAGGGRVEEVSVALVSVRVGDKVLLHAGEAIGVVP